MWGKKETEDMAGSPKKSLCGNIEKKKKDLVTERIELSTSRSSVWRSPY